MRSDKSSGVSKVSSLSIEMRQAIIRLGGPRDWYATRESWLAKAARNAGITYRTAKSLFYCEAEDPRASVVERIRTAIAARCTQDEVKARDEFSELSARLARLEAAMAISDQEFFGPAIDGLRNSIPSTRGDHRTVDKDLE